MRRTLLAAAGAACALATASGARASDHTNLESGLPVVIEDAYVTPYNALEAQGFLTWDRFGRGPRDGDSVALTPRVEWGAARNLQVSLEAPYRLGTGSAPDTRQGDVTASALYNFNTEGIVAPAFSLGGGASTTYGYQNGGTELNVQAVATKSLGAVGESYVPRRLSLEAIYYRNVDQRVGDRADRWRVGAAYAQPVTNDLVAVADVYWQQERERGERMAMIEAGGRWQFDPQTTLSFGAGAGLTGRSPDFRILLGFQHSLSWPVLFGFGPLPR